MAFKKQNGLPPSQEDIEAYCETIEDGTGIFCPSWIRSMLCNMADDEIKDALFAWVHYSQGDLAYRPGTSAAKILADSMRPVFRSNLEKRAKRVADSQKANAVRWNKENEREGDQGERIGKKDGRYTPDFTPNEKEGNQRGENGKERKGGKNMQKSAQMNDLKTNALQSDRIPPASLNVNVNVNENVNSTPSKTPASGGLSAGFGGVGFLGVFDLFQSWKDYGEPGANEGRFFAWHCLDGEARAVCEGVRVAGVDKGHAVRSMIDHNEPHKERLQAVAPWKTWQSAWELCGILAGVDDSTRKAFAAEYESHTAEPGIFGTLADKARYVAKNQVNNLAAFLAKRK